MSAGSADGKRSASQGRGRRGESRPRRLDGIATTVSGVAKKVRGVPFNLGKSPDFLPLIGFHMSNIVTKALVISAASILSFSGCNSADPVSAPLDPTDLAVREARGTSPTYTVAQIALLPGDKEGFAWEVNNAGYVVVQSNYWPDSGLVEGHWFIRAGGQNHIINQVVLAISSGATTYLVGSSNGAGTYGSAPARWTFDLATGLSAPSTLDYSGAAGGSAHAVNDIGDAAGTIGYTGGGGDVAIWKIDGTRFLVPNVNPALYEGSKPNDINSVGDVVIQFHDNTPPQLHRGYLRIASGTLVELPPLTGHVSTLVRGVSEPVSGKVYVAGTSDDKNGNYRAVRWTVDRTTGAITPPEAMPERSYSTAMADDGTIAGDISANSGTTPFVWKLTGVTKLNTPKGTNSGRAHSISGNGKYIAGDAKSGGYYRVPIFWTAP